MALLVVLFYVMFQMMIWLAVATLIAMWCFVFAIIFIITFIWMGFDRHRAKRISRPRVPRVAGRDAFGRPVSPMRYSDRS